MRRHSDQYRQPRAAFGLLLLAGLLLVAPSTITVVLARTLEVGPGKLYTMPSRPPPLRKMATVSRSRRASISTARCGGQTIW